MNTDCQDIKYKALTEKIIKIFYIDICVYLCPIK